MFRAGFIARISWFNRKIVERRRRVIVLATIFNEDFRGLGGIDLAIVDRLAVSVLEGRQGEGVFIG